MVSESTQTSADPPRAGGLALLFAVLVAIIMAAALLPGTTARIPQLLPVLLMGVPLLVISFVRPECLTTGYGRVVLGAMAVPLFLVARTASLPDQWVPKRGGVAWDVPWVSLLVLLLAVIWFATWKAHSRPPAELEGKVLYERTFTVAAAACILLGLALYAVLNPKYMMDFSYSLGMMTRVAGIAMVFAAAASPLRKPGTARALTVVALLVACARIVMNVKGGGM